MPEILSLALFERAGRLLAVRRKPDAAPFAAGWLLPGCPVAENDSAEEALERHLHHELGVEPRGFEFAETLYLEDESDAKRYVTNVFTVGAHEGQLRFRAAGEYDDARWLSLDELGELPMPAALREWLVAGRHAKAPARPVAMPASVSPPDNRTSWNAISRAYQDAKQIPTDQLFYGARCPTESELGLIGDVSGLRAIVLGCGGGQDCIALARQGAQVIGVDLSDRQIEYGRRLAEREGVLVTLMQGSVEELTGVDDESQDIAVSLHAMNYVERADLAFREAFRVLRPGSPIVFSVHHPFDACLEDGPPYGVTKSYWQAELDWEWSFPEAKANARMRSWYRPVGEWLMLLIDAGFRIDRVLEPPPTEDMPTPWDASYDIEKMRLIPANLIVKATKP